MSNKNVIGPQITVANALFNAALVFPPLGPNTAWVDTAWNQLPLGQMRPDKLRVTVFSNSTDNNLTSATLWSAFLQTQVIADDVIEAFTHGAETATLTSHAYKTGDGPMLLAVTGDNVLPAALQAYATGVYLIVVDANTVKFAASREAALEGTAIALADDGSGTGTWVITDDTTAPTKRVRWSSKLLGPAGDGAIVQTATGKGWHQMVDHFSDVVAYAFTATNGTDDPEGTSCVIAPVRSEL